MRFAGKGKEIDQILGGFSKSDWNKSRNQKCQLFEPLHKSWLNHAIYDLVREKSLYLQLLLKQNPNVEHGTKLRYKFILHEK